ncbi:hypothetical protein HEL23_006095 [Escherichia coli]|nr:hypothetical protein [Escherichia coli]MBB8068783.1 hypothetical protein [Escherichia coli]
MSSLKNWVVWSLYDGSGYAVKDWAEAGYKCYCFNYDGANHVDYDGVLSTLWRKPDFIFNPCAYGGYLPEDDKHPAFPDVYPQRDAYTKKTCIWCGNGFKQPIFRPVDLNSGDNPGWAKTGGRAKRTKMIRSLTPRGFARAVFLANDRAITRTTLNRVLPD